MEELEERLRTALMTTLSRELHDFRTSLTTEIEKLHQRVVDLESHVNERDDVINQLSSELSRSRSEVSALQTRVEEAEINSRLPCLILSGASMAPRRASPVVTQTAPAAAGPPRQAAPTGDGQGRQSVTSQWADRVSGGGSGQSASRGGEGRGPARGGEREEREDVNALVIETLNRSFPGLGVSTSDIDRAHRLPGTGNRVIIRFTRSGEGSIRDIVMSRRLELRGKELYVSESLTRLRSLIFRSLLAAKREKKLYTVYTRGGHVFFKQQQFGVSTRVDSVDRVRELGYSVLER